MFLDMSYFCMCDIFTLIDVYHVIDIFVTKWNTHNCDVVSMFSLLEQGSPSMPQVSVSERSAECCYVQELLKIMFWDKSGEAEYVPPVPLLYPLTTRIDLATGQSSKEYGKVAVRVQKLQKELKVREPHCCNVVIVLDMFA